MPRRPTLEVQCMEIGWPIHHFHATYLGKRLWSGAGESNAPPEIVVAASITGGGNVCSWCEGGSINLLIKAAALDALAKRNTFGDRSDAVSRFLEAQLTLLKEFEKEILATIRTVPWQRLRENIAEITANRSIQEYYPRVKQEFLLALAGTAGNEFIAKVAEVFFKKPYEYRAGWPDLTVIEDSGIHFIEVKTTDLLHASQLRFAREIANPLGLKCSVVQLQPTE